MLYEPQDFKHLLGMKELSDKQLNTHFELYSKYVKNTDAILELIDEYAGSEEGGKIQYMEARRRLGWEWNGMRLHEYYFDNMIKNGVELDKKSPLYKKIEEDFGSFEVWQKDFKNTGMMRGNGWVVLYFDLDYGQLLNVWVDQHDIGHLAGGIPLLVMDAWEHAYMVDFGIKRAEYIDAFMNIIDWEVVNDRFGLEFEESIEDETTLTDEEE